ncbi:MAG TPA: hypothetical protein DEA73_04845 [Peptococcaceae bacterium]|nr:MAG: hypothetical protein XD51_0298 [Moorella sp. 60_41]HBT47199.1 hypothetical protein [Peptococcaceae bacterium]
MIVLTITNWRRKLVWLLAALLVGAVLLLGQSSWDHSRDSLPAAGVKEGLEQGVAGEQQETLEPNFMERLISKLRQYYRGQ